MEREIIKEGRRFKIKEIANGKLRLIYLGKEDDYFGQFWAWPCDDEAEVNSMIEAVIDPKRFPDDEHRERHRAEIFKNCKW